MFNEIDNFYRWQRHQTLRERSVIWGLLSSGALTLTLSACAIGFNTQLEKFARGAGALVGGVLCGVAAVKSYGLVDSAGDRAAANVARIDLCAWKHAQLVEMATSQAELPQLAPAEAQDSYSPLAQAITSRLATYHCQLTYQGSTVGLQTVTLKFTPESGTKASSVKQLGEEIQLVAQSDIPPNIAIKGGLICLELPRPDRQYIQFSDLIKPQFLPDTEPVKIALGINIDRQLIELLPSDPNSTNVLISGCNGSGKSEFLRSVVASLVLRYLPKRVQIVLIDPKRVTFAGTQWENLSHLWCPVIKDPDEAFGILDRLVEEMEERYKTLEKSQCKDLETFNQRHPESSLPRIFVVIDELAELVLDKPSKEAFDASVKRLGAKGRASGIHLWGATQRPDVKIVSGVIKANLQGRICLRVNDDVESKIALGLDRGGGEKLLGQGDLLYLHAGKLQRLQAPYLEENFYQDACENLGIVDAKLSKKFPNREADFEVDFPNRPTGSYQDMAEKFERMLRLEAEYTVNDDGLQVYEVDSPVYEPEPLSSKEYTESQQQSIVAKYFPGVAEIDLWRRLLTVDSGSSSPSELIKKGLGCTRSEGNRSYQDVGKPVFAYLVKKFGSDEHLIRFKEFLDNG